MNNTKTPLVTHTHKSLHSCFPTYQHIKRQKQLHQFHVLSARVASLHCHSFEGHKEYRILVIALWAKINHHYLYCELIFTTRNIYKYFYLLCGPLSALSSVVYVIKKRKVKTTFCFDRWSASSSLPVDDAN